MIWLHSYTYRAYPAERAFRKAAEYGYTAIELTGLHWNAKDADNSLQQVLALSRKYGVPVGVLDHGADLTTADEAQWTANIASWETAIRRAAKLGARYVNGTAGSLIGPDWRNFGANGSTLATEQHYDRAAEALNRIARTAEAEGVAVSLEIHMNNIHDSAASTLRLLRDVPSRYVVANIDPGNMFSTKHAEEATKAIELLGDRLGFAHFKNCRIIGETYSALWYSWWLENGDIDYFKVVDSLKKHGYTGPICIEYCGAGDPDIAAEKDIVYLRRVLREVYGQRGA